jgi:hypothetical protein
VIPAAARVIAKLAADGIRVEASGSDIIARPRSALTDEHRALVREHKQELLAELRMPDQGRAAVHKAITRLAADCLDWYRDDLYALASMTPDEVEGVVCDYLSRRQWYRSRTASGDAQ